MDLDKIKEIIAIMNENDLAEVEIEEEGKKVRLRKTEVKVTSAPMPAARAVEQAPAQAPEPRHERPQDCEEITSPMVGTFYRASSPDADPYVKIGDRVEPESIICIIEAMKVMNEIKAEMQGEIVDMLVENGDVIEFGQPLFLIRRTAPQTEGEKKA
jgi:acetyl-CoA carboxylase biotin carboxyl carrier protein